MHGTGTYSSAAGEANRPHTRYTLATMVESRAASLRGTVLVQLGNISLSGCYVHTPESLAEHTRVRVILQTGSRKADLWGLIRRQDQNGLGIQFTNGTTVEDWKSLEAIHRAVADQEAASRLGWLLGKSLAAQLRTVSRECSTKC